METAPLSTVEGHVTLILAQSKVNIEMLFVVHGKALLANLSSIFKWFTTNKDRCPLINDPPVLNEVLAGLHLNDIPVDQGQVLKLQADMTLGKQLD